jgi:short-subunit dehydrogenase
MKPLALITGASSGIGLELAKIHAQHGDLIVTARSTTKLQKLKEELEGSFEIQVHSIPKDLSIPDSAQELYDEVSELGLHPDYLINNAGIGDFGLYHETDWYKDETMINLNILALSHLTKLFGSDMLARKSGRIMNLASTAAFQPGPMMSVYYATKHYVLAFSEGIANEWKDFGVTVTALCPGPTQSGFQETAEMQKSNLVADKRLPSAKEVAKYGYQAMLDGKTVAIHGFKNKILSKGVKLMPRKVVTSTVRKLQAPKDDKNS